MSALSELLGIKEKDGGNLVLLRTRDGFEKRMAVEAGVRDSGEIKVMHKVNDRDLHAGIRSPTEYSTLTYRRFRPTGINEDGVEVWEEQ